MLLTPVQTTVSSLVSPYQLVHPTPPRWLLCNSVSYVSIFLTWFCSLCKSPSYVNFPLTFICPLSTSAQFLPFRSLKFIILSHSLQIPFSSSNVIKSPMFLSTVTITINHHAHLSISPRFLLQFTSHFIDHTHSSIENAKSKPSQPLLFVCVHMWIIPPNKVLWILTNYFTGLTSTYLGS